MECLTSDPLTCDEQQWEQEIDTELSYKPPHEPRPRLWANRWEQAGIIGSWLVGCVILVLVLAPLF